MAVRRGWARKLCCWCGVLAFLGGCTATPVSPLISTPTSHIAPEGTRARSSPVAPSPTAPPGQPTTATVPGRSTPRATPSPVGYDYPRVLVGPAGPVTVIAWSPDGTRFATSSGAPPDTQDHAIRVWSTEGVPLATLTEHTAAVTSLAWSPDSSVLASGSLDRTVRLWRYPDTGQSTLVGAAPSGQVFSLAWSPDGTALAVGTIGIPTGLAGLVRLYRPDGQLFATLHTRLAGNTLLMTGGKFLNLAWSPDGRLLAAGAVDYAIWRADGTLIASIYQGGTPAWGMVWSPDGQRLAIGDENGTVALYSATGEVSVAWHQNGPVAGLGSLAFAPDGRTLAIGSRDSVRLLRVADPQADPLVLHTGTDASVAWSPDGRRLAAGDRGNVVRLWHTDAMQEAPLGGCDSPLLDLAWSPDGKILVAGTAGNSVCIWQVR
jgi:WD40 repeat protein